MQSIDVDQIDYQVVHHKYMMQLNIEVHPKQYPINVKKFHAPPLFTLGPPPPPLGRARG